MSLMLSFCAVPGDVLDEIWDLIESVLRVFLPTLVIVRVVAFVGLFFVFLVGLNN